MKKYYKYIEIIKDMNEEEIYELADSICRKEYEEYGDWGDPLEIYEDLINLQMLLDLGMMVDLEMPF